MLGNRRANQMPWPRGSTRYALATMAELRVFSPLRYRLTLDGEVREQLAMLVAIGNTSSYGGGMLICPKADPYDGLLDVTIIHPVGRLKLLRLFPEMYSGKFVRDPCVEQLRVREVTVEGPGLVGFGDGEMIAAAPLTSAACPRALPVFAARLTEHHGRPLDRPRNQSPAEAYACSGRGRLRPCSPPSLTAMGLSSMTTSARHVRRSRRARECSSLRRQSGQDDRRRVRGFPGAQERSQVLLHHPDQGSLEPEVRRFGAAPRRRSVWPADR